MAPSVGSRMIETKPDAHNCVLGFVFSLSLVEVFFIDDIESGWFLLYNLFNGWTNSLIDEPYNYLVSGYSKLKSGLIFDYSL